MGSIGCLSMHALDRPCTDEWDRSSLVWYRFDRPCVDSIELLLLRFACFLPLLIVLSDSLSLVSKRFRSLLASPEIYKARSLLGHTETCLYVVFESNPHPLWYTLCLKPNQTLTDDTGEKKKKSSGYVLARVPIPSSPHVRFPGLVAVGYNIYSIEEEPYYGKKEERSSSDVWILDCRTHTWCEAPSLPVKLLSLSASFLDGKIYVAGNSYSSGSLKNTIEVFDIKTQIWDTESIPLSETEYNSNNSRSTCIDGKFHVMKTITKGVAYNSKESSWDLIGREMGDFLFHGSYCKIENVMYSLTFNGVLKWYDTEVSLWRCLKGLVGLPNFPKYGVYLRLANYGGKMVVLWEVKIENDPYDLRHDGCGYKKIWCAVIALERRQKGREISGTVEWVKNVLTVPKSCYLVKVLDVTV
ncbi:unnamed protein product [Microthlaspi erraticum]|uniref:FKB95-like N-terminal Kelch domain-containing protein n=1 Tax=Microthlaspi erraticum TaxID=1685480 RepID=A0A6D2ISS5_9BRAS|nr:unnamed protein product [Microthlaspi erraticum]